MPNSYKDFVVKCVIEAGEPNEGNVIRTPFTRYQETVWCEGQDVTYQYRTDPKLLDKTCVMFCQVIDEHPTIPSEVKKAEEYQNTLGISRVDVLSKAQPEVKVELDGKETVKQPTLKAVESASLLTTHVKEPENLKEVAEIEQEQQQGEVK